MANSQPGTPSQTTQKPRKMVRKRAAVACDECRLSKRRCDGAAPACGACMKRVKTCEYASDGHGHGQPADWRRRIIQSLRNQLEELEKADGQPTHATTGQLHQHDNHESTARVVQDRQYQFSARGDPDDEERSPPHDTIDVTRRIDMGRSGTSLPPTREESPLLKGQESHGPPRATPDPLELPEAQSTSPEEIRASYNLERMMEPIIDQITDDNETSHRTDISNISLSTHKAISIDAAQVQSKMDCKCDNLLHSRRQWYLPLRRSADALVTRYFSRHNRAFPVLHERTFRRQYERLWESEAIPASTTCCSGLCKQRSQGKLLLPTTYAIFAYASLFETSQPEQNTVRAKNFFRMAQEVDLFQILNDEVGIELVQLLLLMGKYLQSTEHLSKFKNISGLTIRMAQSMGLHYGVREAQQRGLLSDPATQLECEMRARVWHGCVLLERDIPLYLCFGRSLGPAISDENHPLPRAIDDEQLSDEVGSNGEQPGETPSALESFLASIKLHSIMSQALGRDNCYPENVSDPSITIRSLLRLDNLMHNWRNGLPEHLQFESSLDDSSQEADPTALVEGNLVESSESLIQAKKLHLRYLHASQIILRPALHLYFKRTQSRRSSSKTRERRHDDLEDLMLTTMAAKCVVTAVTIIDLLGTQSDAHIFVAWWFNIAYLHTCGSTILMARLCTFNDARFNTKSLVASWNSCLRILKRYSNISSIARKSAYLLHQSAERLISARQSHSQATNLSHGEDAAAGSSTAGLKVPRVRQRHDMMESEQWLKTNLARGANTPDIMMQGAQAMDRSGQSANSSWKDNNRSMMELSDESSGMPSFLDPNLDFEIPPDLDDNFWAASSFDLPSWSLLPSIDQLETSPPRFDF